MIGPTADVGNADATVRDGPLRGDFAATVGGTGRADRLNSHIGIGDGHHIRVAGRTTIIISLAAVLPHGTGGIAPHVNFSVSTKGRTELIIQTLRVISADGKASRVQNIAQHKIVTVAQHGVGGIDDAVRPTRRTANTHTHVLNGPFNGKAGRVIDHAAGCRDAHYRQVGKVVAGDGEAQAVLIVGFTQTAFVVIIASVGNDD